MKNKYPILLSLSLFLTIGIYLVTARIYHLNEIYRDRPQNIVATNITPTSARIYWQGENTTIPNFSYIEKDATGLFTKSDIAVSKDNISGLNIFYTELTNLDPNSTYIFEIKADEYVWDDISFAFDTKDINAKPALPNIATGTESPMDLLILEKDGDIYMLDTQYHGTWAMDLGESEDYEVTKYANYMSEENLREYSSLLRIPLVNAASGANCKVGSSAEYSNAPKSKFVKVANNWTPCHGHYGDECYSDVVCRASKSGVNPAFALTSWLRESAASNYGLNSSVQDFGINGAGIPNLNFDKQIDYYLDMISGIDRYITNQAHYDRNNCTYTEASNAARIVAPNRDPRLIIYGAIYWTGNPCASDKGLEYMSTMFTVYKWLTGEELTWSSIRKSTTISGCSFSGTNSEYNACDGTSSSGSSSRTPVVKDTSATLQCGQSGCTKDSDCIGYESGDYECDEVSSHKASDQYCKVIGCPEGQERSDDGCSCVVSKEYTLTLNEGINFISFDVNPFSGSIKITAEELLESNSNIVTVGEYLGDEWSGLLTKKDGNILGEDFNLKGERAYLIITEKDIEITYYGSNTLARDLSNYKGWSLIPTTVIGKASTQSIITDYADLKINQIAVWDYPTAFFEDLVKDVDGTFYGENISLTDIETLFIKVE